MLAAHTTQKQSGIPKQRNIHVMVNQVTQSIPPSQNASKNLWLSRVFEQWTVRPWPAYQFLCAKPSNIGLGHSAVNINHHDLQKAAAMSSERRGGEKHTSGLHMNSERWEFQA
mmetsp:Transcript_64946/g.174362  ORF Transcript_64946/g.174362 Transcript_64946/m.174362 type:complete len:113 (+) Transcript_64946:149-487(+)